MKHYSEEELSLRLATYRKIIVVRDPFESGGSVRLRRYLRKESKVDEIARRVWSESTSDESEEVLTPRPRSLQVKTADLSPGRVDGNQARHARAYSEPPEVPRLKSAFTSGQESPATSKKESEQYAVRDLPASKKLVREVDQVLDGLLEPTSRARGKIAERGGNHRSSSTSSCGSNSSTLSGTVLDSQAVSRSVPAQAQNGTGTVWDTTIS
ncbi:hypothetical protein Bbelb_393860 [Branchiostoma belcheri]|nr:hypothetical protein Bbelb_393860 [Branchiostoma belcheri]